MKKIFATILAILAIVLFALFFVMFNIQSVISKPNKAKLVITNSNFYTTTANYIKEQIVEKTDYPLNEGSNFELLNKNINTESVKITIEKAIDSFFVALKNPTSANLIFPVIFAGGDEAAIFSFEKNVNLNGNLLFGVMININKILISIGLAASIFFVFSVLLFSKEVKVRLLIIGNSFVFLGGILLVIKIATDWLLPKFYDRFLNDFNLFQEQKLIIGLQKVITVFFNQQTLNYTIEITGFFIMGLALIFSSKAFSKEKLAEIDEKI